VPIITLLLIFSQISWSTSFAIQSIDKQLGEADGVIIGHYLKKKSVQLENGSIATQMIFKVQKEWGLNSDLFGVDEIIIHYPGGKLGDKHVYVQGIPEFISGERVALLAKSVQNRFWGLNLGLGSYKIINYHSGPMLVNSLFPQDERIGQIKMEDFENKVRHIKSGSLRLVKQDLPGKTDQVSRSPASVEEGKKRAIASSMDKVDNNEDQSNPGVFWLVAILALAGGLSRLLRSRNA